jgi:hypothetical protein
VHCNKANAAATFAHAVASRITRAMRKRQSRRRRQEQVGRPARHLRSVEPPDIRATGEGAGTLFAGLRFLSETTLFLGVGARPSGQMKNRRRDRGIVSASAPEAAR